MKTPDEIKKDTETCLNHPSSMACNYCRLYNECGGAAEHIIKELYDLVIYYESRLAQAERERDAAVADIEKYKGCGTCKFQDVQNDCDKYQNCCKCDNTDCPCYGASVDDCWQWRGVCAENTKEE